MYDKYFLTEDQLDTISNWFKKSNEPLFICGGPGSGKTSLAKDILNDRVVTIVDSLSMKNNSDIYEYIQNIIQKRNITMMFSQKKEKRGLIIDDLDILYKHDKKIFKSILNLLMNYNYYGTQIIITSSIKFLNNRPLSKLKYSKLFLVYNNHIIHKICKNICEKNNLKITLSERQELIKKSSGNLNSLTSQINLYNRIETHSLDNFDESGALYDNLFKNDYSMADLIRIYSSNKTKISLDLLENMFTITLDPIQIRNIYNYYVISDIFETQCINHPDIREYDTIMTIFNFNYRIRKASSKNKNFIGNKYISKSLIHTYSQKLNCRYADKNLIYFYLYLININKYDKRIVEKIISMNRKELEFYVKSFNYYYGSKIKVEKIYKLIK